MAKIRFADIVTENLGFDLGVPSQKLVTELIQNPWIQRLRDISQTGNTKLVYMFSEHSRFGHSVGVAFLATQLLEKLEKDFPEQIKEYSLAVSAAALLHDIAHLAPGSHTAQKVWFPKQKDSHEAYASKIIQNDASIKQTLENFTPELVQLVSKILVEDSSLPAWTWQIISGGGWNVDRGNWCIADSVMAGVSYGKYNITALTDSITIDANDNLALKENRLDAMLHFAVSRHAMYKQVYQHRVLLAADELTKAIVKRCRAISNDLYFADSIMQKILLAESVDDLDIQDIFYIRESWWKYHLIAWTKSEDPILADLASRLLNRRLFKTVLLHADEEAEESLSRAQGAVKDAGYEPEYYLFKIDSIDRFVEEQQLIKVLREDGSITNLKDMDTVFQVILQNASEFKKTWLVMPAEAKEILGKKR